MYTFNVSNNLQFYFPKKHIYYLHIECNLDISFPMIFANTVKTIKLHFFEIGRKIDIVMPSYLDISYPTTYQFLFIMAHYHASKPKQNGTLRKLTKGVIVCLLYSHRINYRIVHIKFP